MMSSLQLQTDRSGLTNCFNTSLSCFVKCFYFPRYEVLASCQKWVALFPRWYSVGGTKAFLRTSKSISEFVGMVLNV